MCKKVGMLSEVCKPHLLCGKSQVSVNMQWQDEYTVFTAKSIESAHLSVLDVEQVGLFQGLVGRQELARVVEEDLFFIRR